MQQRIFSGIQPTSGVHLGNYLGAIRNWVELQKSWDCIFCVVDLHALTVVQDAAAMRANTLEITAALLACGIDPDRSVLFVQSAVPAHSELCWIFNCIAPMGWLGRMTQFKEKAGRDREGAPVGLFDYPVLQAADILVHRATHVPVGEDQKQHLELSRDIAAAFNRKFGSEYFPLPEPMILGEATRVMSLRDGTKKMSKSDPSEQSRISLTDDADAIALKIRRAKSDSIMGVSYDPEGRPEASNLLTIYAALDGRPRGEAEAELEAVPFAQFKSRLADLAVARLAPINAEMRRLMADMGHLHQVLRRGAERARTTAGQVIADVHDLVGFHRG